MPPRKGKEEEEVIKLQSQTYGECFNTNRKAGYAHLSASRKESSPSGQVVALALLARLL